MNEATLNLLGCSVVEPEGQAFAVRILDWMRERMSGYQEETHDIFNLEATPAEGASYRLAKRDREAFPDLRIHSVEAYGSQTPYYTNSTQLPVGFDGDLFEALTLQDPLQTRYTGGTVFHAFLGERLPGPEATRRLVRRIAEGFRLPYYTVTPTFSICPEHGTSPGSRRPATSADRRPRSTRESSATCDRSSSGTMGSRRSSPIATTTSPIG